MTHTNTAVCTDLHATINQQKREIAALRADKTKLERELADTKRNGKAYSAPAPAPAAQRQQRQPPATDAGSIQLDRSKYPDIRNLSRQAWERLCTPNRRGQLPCIECLKLGMKLFHLSCDPVKRQEAYDRRKSKAPPKKKRKSVHFEEKFPPNDADRQFPLSLYDDDTHCKHCKREDVAPSSRPDTNPIRATEHPEGLVTKRGPKPEVHATKWCASKSGLQDKTKQATKL